MENEEKPPPPPPPRKDIKRIENEAVVTEDLARERHYSSIATDSKLKTNNGNA